MLPLSCFRLESAALPTRASSKIESNLKPWATCDIPHPRGARRVVKDQRGSVANSTKEAFRASCSIRVRAVCATVSSRLLPPELRLRS